MKKTFITLIMLISFYSLSFSVESTMYNCVDCSYDKTAADNEAIYKQLLPYVVYQKPNKVKLFIQNFNCKNCGMFEVSVRKEMKQINKKEKK